MANIVHKARDSYSTSNIEIEVKIEHTIMNAFTIMHLDRVFKLVSHIRSVCTTVLYTQ